MTYHCSKCKFSGTLSFLKLNKWICLIYFSWKQETKVKSLLKGKQLDYIRYNLWLRRKKTTNHKCRCSWWSFKDKKHHDLIKSLKSPVDIYFDKEEKERAHSLRVNRKSSSIIVSPYSSSTDKKICLVHLHMKKKIYLHVKIKSITL